MAVTLGQDWPTEELQDVLRTYGVRILGRERRHSGRAPWWMGAARVDDRRLIYDAEATWTETHYLFRREMACESCGKRFGYNFEVDQVSRVHRLGRSTDGSLRRELGRQLRRRIRCPHCRAVQTEPRRTLTSIDRKQTGSACALVLLGFVLFAALGGLGGWLGGIIGFFVGLLVALASTILLWFFFLPYILGIGSAI
jgi:hypothetical protein